MAFNGAASKELTPSAALRAGAGAQWVQTGRVGDWRSVFQGQPGTGCVDGVRRAARKRQVLARIWIR